MNCSICKEEFTLERDLNRHKAFIHNIEFTVIDVINENNKYISCHLCSAKRVFQSNYNLKTHLMRVHSFDLDTGTFEKHVLNLITSTCAICYNKGRILFFYNSAAYNLHLTRSHIGNQLSKKDFSIFVDLPLICKWCFSIFKCGHDLISHLSKCVAGFTCHLCPAKFAHKKCLRNHKHIVHTEANQYLCKICGKSYRQAHLLRRHNSQVNCAHPQKQFGTKRQACASNT